MICHNASEQAGGLDLTTRSGALAGGDSGEPAYLETSPDDSVLLQRIAAGEMPPDGKGKALTKEEVEQVASWIAPAQRGPPIECSILSRERHCTAPDANGGRFSPSFGRTCRRASQRVQ